MTRKWTRESRGMFFTWGVLVGLIFLFTPQSLTGRLQLAYAQIFRWPLEAGRDLTLVARTTVPQTPNGTRNSYEQLLAEKQRLEIDRANLQAKLHEACQRINQLAKLSVQPEWENMGVLPAGVIQAQNGLTINRGSKDGVMPGQFALSLDGSIVGTIAAISPRVATVRLITDSDSKIPVFIGDPNVVGFMEGRGNGLARIPLTSNKHKVRVGDRVYVQKKTGWLDVPIVAAEVIQCGKDPDHPVVPEITVRPICNVGDLSEIVVVIPAARPR